MKPKWFVLNTSSLITGLLATALVIAAGAVLPQFEAGAAPDAAVTFTRDVAPILQRACQNCHRPGSIAPMALVWMPFGPVRVVP